MSGGPLLLNWRGWQIDAYGAVLLPHNGGSVFSCEPENPSSYPWGGTGSIRGLTIWTKDNPASGALISVDNCDDLYLNDLTLAGGFEDIDVASSIHIHVNGLEAVGDNSNSGTVIMRFRKGMVPGRKNGNNSEIVVDGFNLRSLNPGTYTHGLVVSNADGIQFANGHVGFTSGDAIYIQPGGTNQQLTGLVFNGVNADGAGNLKNMVACGWHFDGVDGYTSASGFHQLANSGAQITTGDGICVTDASLRGLTLSAVSMIINGTRNGSGIHISAGTNVSIAGGQINDTNRGQQSSSRHILIDGNARSVIVSGMAFAAAPNASVAYDVEVAGAASNIVIGPNVHSGATKGAVINNSKGPTILVFDNLTLENGSNR
jgi:hypothetical protein